MSFGSGMRRKLRRSAPNCRRFVAQAQTLEEWEVPRERPENWDPAETEPLLAEFWESACRPPKRD